MKDLSDFNLATPEGIRAITDIVAKEDLDRADRIFDNKSPQKRDCYDLKSLCKQIISLVTVPVDAHFADGRLYVREQDIEDLSNNVEIILLERE